MNMHRLYWKIFVSFWIALALLLVAVVLISSHFIEEMRHRDSVSNPIEYIARHLSEAQDIATHDGLTGLKTWAQSVDRDEAVPVLVLDANAVDILKRPVPERIAARISARALSGDRDGEHERGRPRFTIHLTDGTPYQLVPDFQSVTLNRILRRPKVIAFPILIAAVVSGLVCLLLARYLVFPIERLQSAVDGYAAGDLSRRVGPTLGGRRDEIVDLAHAFDRMAERLNALMHSHKQLLSDVSHELRSPLARLQAALGLARLRGNEAIQPDLDRIERESERLNDLIGQLLSLARLESGKHAPTFETIDLTALVRSIGADAALEHQSQRKRVTITAHEPVSIQGNPPLLHSAIENVVRNAMKYTNEQTDVSVRVAHEPDHERVTVSVRDHGPGVPEDMLPHLFEPFVRVGDDRNRNTGGYGLGLAIAERAIRLHQGTVTARNNVDGGLTVAIQLPVQNIAAQGPRALPA